MSESIVQNFAKRISGLEYPIHDKNLDLKFAKKNNLVIAFGASDDLLEFRGAINEELGAYEGTLAYILNGNAVQEGEFDDDFIILQKYNVLAEKPLTTVESIWQPEGLNASWIIKVNGFESAPFDVMEDGKLYCRGAVFLVKSIYEDVLL